MHLLFRVTLPEKTSAAPCSACAGKGWITGADLGITGLSPCDAEPIPIPCLLCEGTGQEPLGEEDSHTGEG